MRHYVQAKSGGTCNLYCDSTKENASLLPPFPFIPHPYSPCFPSTLSSVLSGTPRIPRTVNQTLGAIRAVITRRYLEDRQLIISCIYNSPKCLPVAVLPPPTIAVPGLVATCGHKRRRALLILDRMEAPRKMSFRLQSSQAYKNNFFSYCLDSLVWFRYGAGQSVIT